VPAHPDNPRLSDEVIELVAARLAALGDPTRVRLLDALRRRGELSVGELAAEAGAGYANAAKHLSLLHRERILSRRKEGSWVLYRIADRSVLAICELVCGSLASHVRELEQLIRNPYRESITEEVEG
jgi:DNA-binding transcriptional ArsR family regulator